METGDIHGHDDTHNDTNTDSDLHGHDDTHGDTHTDDSLRSHYDTHSDTHNDDDTYCDIIGDAISFAIRASICDVLMSEYFEFVAIMAEYWTKL